MANPGNYRIYLSDRWALEDLYKFPRAYSQTYAFVYCLDSELHPKDAERIDRALKEYPWRGGYSYVNIYNVLQHQVPGSDRPEIATIQYGSPGWMDLLLNPEVALQIAQSVGILLGIGVAVAKTYARIQRELASMKKRRKESQVEGVKLTREELAILMGISDDIAEHLGFGSVRKLHERTGNPEISLKLLSAHYRVGLHFVLRSGFQAVLTFAGRE